MSFLSTVVWYNKPDWSKNHTSNPFITCYLQKWKLLFNPGILKYIFQISIYLWINSQIQILGIFILAWIITVVAVHMCNERSALVLNYYWIHTNIFEVYNYFTLRPLIIHFCNSSYIYRNNTYVWCHQFPIQYT